MKKNTVSMNPSALMWGLLIELTFISRCSNFFIIQGTMIMLLIMITIIILIMIFIMQQLCHHTEHVITMIWNSETAMCMGLACSFCLCMLFFLYVIVPHFTWEKFCWKIQKIENESASWMSISGNGMHQFIRCIFHGKDAPFSKIHISWNMINMQTLLSALLRC